MLIRMVLAVMFAFAIGSASLVFRVNAVLSNSFSTTPAALYIVRVGIVERSGSAPPLPLRILAILGWRRGQGDSAARGVMGVPPF